MIVINTVEQGDLRSITKCSVILKRTNLHLNTTVPSKSTMYNTYLEIKYNTVSDYLLLFLFN